jgi:hypothetical protein
MTPEKLNGDKKSTCWEINKVRNKIKINLVKNIIHKNNMHGC